VAQAEFYDREKTMCISSSGIIELTGLEFHAFHGCLEQERREGSVFVVDFKGCCPIGRAAASDELEDTADCRKIYDIIALQMSIRSKLLENVASRIANSLGEAFPEFESIEVKVSKTNPPLPGKCKCSSVTAYWKK